MQYFRKFYEPISATTAGLIMAGTAIAGNGANMIAQGKTNKKSREHAEKMYQWQLADNRYNWDLQNAYNHPAEQMARLKAAGLNPALMYGGGVGNMSAGSIQGGSPRTSYATPPQLDMGALAASGQTMINSQRLQNENALTKADIEVKRNQSIKLLTEAESIAIDNKTRDELNNRRSTLLHYQAENQYENANLAFSRREAVETMQEPNKQNALADLALKEAKLQLTPLQASKLKSDIQNGKLKAQFQGIINDLYKGGINPNDPGWYKDLKKNIGGVIELYKASMNSDDDFKDLNPLD
jgi:hypothetical protein